MRRRQEQPNDAFSVSRSTEAVVIGQSEESDLEVGGFEYSGGRRQANERQKRLE